jgi:pimeloyl-ACP methyl ester carboxylesterase
MRVESPFDPRAAEVLPQGKVAARNRSRRKARTMKHPLNDLVVVLPGVMGSELRDANGDAVWSTSMGSVVKGLLTRGKAIKRLQLPDGIGDAPAPDGVTATALLRDIHVIPGIWSVSIGYEQMMSWFRSNFEVVEPGAGVANFVQFPYDWRLSNRASARALQHAVEPLLERLRAQPGKADARVVFIGHSMGGLIARYYVDVLGGHEITRKVITLGTPHRGALNALTSLVNGVSKGFGPLKVNLTDFSRSLPSLFQLLPEYACIDTAAGLRKTTEVALPELGTAAVADAMRFHEELRVGARAHGRKYDAHPIIARTQPTDTTARIVDGCVKALRTIGGVDEGGDSTVPRLSAVPYGVAADSPIVRYVKEKHGALPANDPVLIELEGVLTANDVIARDAGPDIGVICDDLNFAGEPIDVAIEAESGLVIDAVLHRDDGTVMTTSIATDQGNDGYGVEFTDVPPGFYVLRVGARGVAERIASPLAVLPKIDADESGD